MIEASEIIDCKSFQKICDYQYDAPNLDDIPPSGLVHVPLDQIEEFFNRVDSNGQSYVVVSSCSDYGFAIQQEHPPWRDMLKWLKMQIGPHLKYHDVKMPARLEQAKCNLSDTFSVKCQHWTRATVPFIPHNIHHWFITNLMFVPDPETYTELYQANTYEKITAIPFGVAEGQQEKIYEKMSLRKNETERKNKIYISWNDYTFERYELRESMLAWNSYAKLDAITSNSSDEPDPYDKYLDNLLSHKYVISPAGNGVDCYRTLESIYMGCITFVEDNPTNYLTGLPVYKYQNIDDIIGCYNGNHQMPDGFEDQPQIKLSYWRNLIEEKRDELF